MYEALHFQNEDLLFEWDDEKSRSNFVKHGIRFQTAVKAFLDPRALVRLDEEHSQEQRYNLLGKVGRVLFVVYVKKEEATIRIISARIATKLEQERYEYGAEEDE